MAKFVLTVKSEGLLKELAERIKKEKGYTRAYVGITSEENAKYKPRGNNKTEQPSLAQIGRWQEYGWTQRITSKQAGWFWFNHKIHLKTGNTLYLPPRPFLGMTVKVKGDEWKKIFKKSFLAGNSISDSVQLMATEAAQDIRDTLNNGGVGGVKFAPRSWITQKIYKNLYGGKRKDGTGYRDGTQALVSLSSHIGIELVK